MHIVDPPRAMRNGAVRSRRRSPDVFEWGFALLLLLGFVVAAALAAAVMAGAVWAAVWFVQDIARRLGGG